MVYLVYFKLSQSLISVSFHFCFTDHSFNWFNFFKIFVEISFLLLFRNNFENWTEPQQLLCNHATFVLRDLKSEIINNLSIFNFQEPAGIGSVRRFVASAADLGTCPLHSHERYVQINLTTRPLGPPSLPGSPWTCRTSRTCWTS